MDDILTTLKMKDMTPTAKREYKNLCACVVIVVDDLMNIAVSRDEGKPLFSFINKITSMTKSSLEKGK